jgi:hypothetical protein
MIIDTFTPEEGVVLYEQLRDFSRPTSIAIINSKTYPKITKSLVIGYYTAMFDEDKGPVEPPENFYAFVDYFQLPSQGLLNVLGYFTVKIKRLDLFNYRADIENLAFDESVLSNRRHMCYEIMEEWADKHFSKCQQIGYLHRISKLDVDGDLNNLYNQQCLGSKYFGSNEPLILRYNEADCITRDIEEHMYLTSGAEKRYALTNILTNYKTYFDKANNCNIANFDRLFELLKRTDMFKSYRRLESLHMPRNDISIILQDDIVRRFNHTSVTMFGIFVNRESNPIYEQMYEFIGVCICTFRDKVLTLHDLAVDWELADDAYITEYICRQLIDIFAPEQFYLYLRASYFSDKAKFNQLKYIQDHFELTGQYNVRPIRKIANASDAKSTKEEPNDKPSLHSREG